MSEQTPEERYNTLKARLCHHANWENEPTRDASFYAAKLPKAFVAEYGYTAIAILDEIFAKKDAQS